MAKYIILGGVAGGATTAARLRRMDEKSEIILFEKGKHISYANCGLPYYIGDVITERDRLFVQTPESFGKRFDLEVRVESMITAIDKDNHKVKVKKVASGEEYEESYDKLILSPGAEPLRPNLKGINSAGIFTLRNVPDTDQIKEYIQENDIRRAVVIGAGFIGLEMAENLHDQGIFVTIVEMAHQVMTPLDYSMATLVHQHLKTKDVEFYLSDAVSSFEEHEAGVTVHLTSGRKLPADMVILSIGVKPDSRVAAEAGLEIGERGGIRVNEFLQTSDPDIYAVGDAIEYPNPITKQMTSTYLAGPANKQGRIVADNIVKNNTSKYHGAISTAIAKVFDLTVASTGLSGKSLKDAEFSYVSSITHSSSHAGYYPGALPLTIKINFSPDDGRLYGAQIVGFEGVDKRIDLMATIIKNNGTIWDLTEIEHAYAPPYSSAKDPVNIAGFAADNIINGTVKIVKWNELLYNENNDDHFIVDVRIPEEFQLGSIQGAVNIPLDDIRERMDEIPRDKKVVLFCGIGLRAYVGCRILYQNGYEEVYNLSGGYKIYEHVAMKQSNEDIFESDYIGKDDNIYQADVDHPNKKVDSGHVINIDACGLQCPGPIMKLSNKIKEAGDGDTIEISATDPGFLNDIKSWSKVSGNELLNVEQEKGVISAKIRKLGKEADSGVRNIVSSDKQTLIVFSDDLDKALASFVLATGGVSSGKKVTMFFTFWGLNVIKKAKKPKVKKDLMGRMFGWMMPASSKNLKLSKMNMGGMGTSLMRSRMKNKQIDSLETLIAQARDSGVEMIACNMSMDVMGVSQDELMDHVEMGGVAAYIQRADEAGINLFV